MNRYNKLDTYNFNVVVAVLRALTEPMQQADVERRVPYSGFPVGRALRYLVKTGNVQTTVGENRLHNKLVVMFAVSDKGRETLAAGEVVEKNLK